MINLFLSGPKRGNMKAGGTDQPQEPLSLAARLEEPMGRVAQRGLFLQLMFIHFFMSATQSFFVATSQVYSGMVGPVCSSCVLIAASPRVPAPFIQHL